MTQVDSTPHCCRGIKRIERKKEKENRVQFKGPNLRKFKKKGEEEERKILFAVSLVLFTRALSIILV